MAKRRMTERRPPSETKGGQQVKGDEIRRIETKLFAIMGSKARSGKDVECVEDTVTMLEVPLGKTVFGWASGLAGTSHDW